MCKVISSTILVLFNIPLVIIGLGLVVFGALIRWNEKLLYAAFLLVIFLALLVFTIVFGTRKHWFRDELGISYRRSITSDYHMDNNFPPNTGFTVFVNEIQRKHKCCGSFDYRDFQDNESFKRQNYKIPASCCKDIKDKECWERPTTQNSYKDTGCFEFLWSAAQPSYRIILYILIGLLLLTFTFAVISIYLLTRYSREKMQLL
ncbi:unnamed protein product [Schistosoma guineensis]|nr:unnamed protein product [Schistosoma guineensis]